MKHARSDYDHIVDPSGKIPKDEPVFLLRGQDKLAPKVLRVWIEEYVANGGDTHHANQLEKHAQAMEKWQEDVKGQFPTIPPGVMDDPVE